MKTRLLQLLRRSMTPLIQKYWIGDLVFAIPRVVCGFLLTSSFGSDKFGLPWSSKANLGFFEVVAWFPEDVASYGGIFALAPVFFAWMGAFSEAVGGLLLMLGLKTRIASFLIMCTMLVAIFMQKWGQGVWSMLPAMGFLWVSMYHVYTGSGRFGLDYLMTKKQTS
ncbi:DoxX family protein [Flavobacteriaceae bacterium S356]|uniref:DoxX family protein n=1 Tax=Asprobacillus argus TaxID=3076534 RepID=A0ABU3LD55_9FLAO|nr:DoxX family protein [Flavobacteriaceae bacterium S356]